MNSGFFWVYFWMWHQREEEAQMVDTNASSILPSLEERD
jgi:hypothetical protein